MLYSHASFWCDHSSYLFCQWSDLFQMSVAAGLHADRIGIFSLRCTALENSVIFSECIKSEANTEIGQQPIISYCMSPPAKQLGVASPCWHRGSQLWWSNLTYVPLSYTTWHDPLISRSMRPNPAICPKAKVQRAPAVPHCPLRGPPSRDAKEQKGDIPTFCLSRSNSQLQSSPG